MPNRWTKKLPLLALSAALLLTCCACAAQAEEEKGETAAKTAGTEAYSLTLPATITAKEQENNTLTLFLDGTEWAVWPSLPMKTQRRWTWILSVTGTRKRN